MKKIALFAVIAFLMAILPGHLFAQQEDSRIISLEANYSAFRLPDDSSNSYVEIYYNIRRSQLKYEPLDKGYEAIIDFKLDLKDSSGNVLNSVSWKGANQIAKLSDLNDKNYLISDMLADRLPPGQYQVDLFISNGDKKGHAAFDMNIPSFMDQEPGLSTLELAYKIAPDSVGKFVKNGLLVMPNPSGMFLQENGKMNVYAEGYGLDTSSVADSMFYIQLEVLTKEGQTITSFAPISYHKPGESAVIVNTIPIDSMQSGDYDLKMTLTDGHASTSVTRPFSVIMRRENAKRALMQGVLRDFPEANRLTNDDDAKKFRDEITYIATSDELKLYDSLNLTGKAAFQKDFWARRDPDPSSPRNDFEIEHYRRMKYANDAFGQFQGEHAGWKTDRGRVYILYGEPSQIERFPQSNEARAWERWWYNSIEGGVYFVFVDLENSTDYTLIHSSKQNEPKNYNWEDVIKMSYMNR
jgi:GWxTD domain-containing protein